MLLLLPVQVEVEAEEVLALPLKGEEEVVQEQCRDFRGELRPGRRRPQASC